MVYKWHMEDKKSKYDLPVIKNTFMSIKAMNRTKSSRKGARAIGFSDADVIGAIQAMEAGNFYKSMTSHHNSNRWQDIYHAEWKGKSLYMKFTTDSVGNLLLISFKEK